MENLGTKVLEALFKSFQEGAQDIDSLEYRFLRKEESGLETDILTTLHQSFGTMSNTAEGDFFFDEDTFFPSSAF